MGKLDSSSGPVSGLLAALAVAGCCAATVPPERGDLSSGGDRWNGQLDRVLSAEEQDEVFDKVRGTADAVFGVCGDPMKNVDTGLGGLTGFYLGGGMVGGFFANYDSSVKPRVSCKAEEGRGGMSSLSSFEPEPREMVVVPEEDVSGGRLLDSTVSVDEDETGRSVVGDGVVILEKNVGGGERRCFVWGDNAGNKRFGVSCSRFDSLFKRLKAMFDDVRNKVNNAIQSLIVNQDRS